MKGDIIGKISRHFITNYNHILSIIIIFILSTLLFYKSMYMDGQLLYVDMLLPNDINRILEFVSYTWYPYGSFFTNQIIMRLPWISLSLIPSIILKINTDIFILLLFIFTFFIAGLSSYLLTYYGINMSRSENKNKFTISFASMIVSLIYMYNPFSIGLFWAYGFYPTYALFPALLLLVIISLNGKKKWHLFVTAFIMMMASTSVHGVMWIFAILLYSFIFFTIIDFNVERLIVNLKKIIIITIIYLMLTLFWILPFLVELIGGVKNLNYVFTEQMLNSLSNMSSIVDSLRLTSGARFLIPPEFIGSDIIKEMIPEITASLKYISITNPSSIDDKFWILSSFLFPILALGSLFLCRKNSFLRKMTVFFTILVAISSFLSLGTNSPFSYVYKWMAIDAPWANSFGWIFRAPYRFQIFSSIGLSVMYGYSIYKILDIGSKHRKYKLFANILIIFLLLSMTYFLSPMAIAHADYIFAPTIIPEEYNTVNSWLESKTGDFKILWLPKYTNSGYIPSWAPYKRIGPINIVSSSKESISNFLNKPAEDYLNLLHKKQDSSGKLILNSTVYADNSAYDIDFGKMVLPLGVRYIVLDNSMKNSGKMKYDLDNSSGIRLVFNGTFIYIYENINLIPRRIDIKEKIIEIENMEQYILLSQTVDLNEIALVNKDIVPTYVNRTSIKDHLINFVENPSFEGGWDSYTNYPEHWSAAYNNKEFNISLDRDIKNSGTYSIKAETNTSKSIGWIKGNEIFVVSGEWILTKSNIRFTDARWVHYVIYGYDNESKIWRQIIHSPSIKSGNSDWKEYIGVFKVPKNIIKIQPRLSLGFIDVKEQNKSTTWFDDLAIYRLNAYDFTANEISNVPATVLNYTKIDPTLYKMKVNSTRPFMFSFAESYDPLWTAKIDKIDGRPIKSEIIHPIPLYSVVNGFWINQTGNLDITIEYEPQRWFYVGASISITTLIICIAYLIYDWRKKKDVIIEK